MHFNILNSQNVLRTLGDYKVLVLPDQTCLSQAEVAAIRRFVERAHGAHRTRAVRPRAKSAVGAVIVVAGVLAYGEEHGWECEQAPYLETTGVAGFRGRAFDGIVARVSPALARSLRGGRVPVVNVWADSPVRGLPGVFPDHEAAGRMAARHLLDRGHRPPRGEAQREVGVVDARGEVCPGDGIEDLERLADDLGPDAVAGDDGDAVRAPPGLCARRPVLSPGLLLRHGRLVS
jgi:hypothetical protein